MIRSDVFFLIICSAYLVFLLRLAKATSGGLRIKRTLTRIVPTSRQRAVSTMIAKGDNKSYLAKDQHESASKFSLAQNNPPPKEPASHRA